MPRVTRLCSQRTILEIERKPDGSTLPRCLTGNPRVDLPRGRDQIVVLQPCPCYPGNGYREKRNLLRLSGDTGSSGELPQLAPSLEPVPVVVLEKRVDEWPNPGSGSENQKQSKDQQDRDHGDQPPELALPQKS